MNEWKSEATVTEYAAKAVDPVTGWYEHEVNFPNLVRLIPEDTKTLLDFGCGPGEFTKKLAKKFPAVTGADMAPMLKIARKNFPDIDFVEWDGLGEIPEKLNGVDTIFSKLTLQFVEDIDLLATNFYKALSVEGSVVFSVPNPHKISEKFNLNYDLVTKYDDEIGDTGIKIYPIHRPEEVYISTFEKAGFKLIETSEPGIPDELMKKYNVPEKYTSKPNRLNFRFQK